MEGHTNIPLLIYVDFFFFICVKKTQHSSDDWSSRPIPHIVEFSFWKLWNLYISRSTFFLAGGILNRIIVILWKYKVKVLNRQSLRESYLDQSSSRNITTLISVIYNIQILKYPLHMNIFNSVNQHTEILAWILWTFSVSF